LYDLVQDFEGLCDGLLVFHPVSGKPGNLLLFLLNPVTNGRFFFHSP
jgi:hypothetical protein